MNDVAAAFHDFGPTAAIAAIFVWQTIVRERRMAKRIDSLENFIRHDLMRTVEANTAALVACTQAIARCTRT